VTTTESLDALISRRDELKSKIDMHLRFDPATDAPGDDLRDELQQTIGKITQRLHEPYRVEADRLAEKRQEIAAELQAAQHQRNALRNALVHAQAARTAILAIGDDPAEHVATADELSAELEGVERTIGELQHRSQGVDAQIVELTVAEGAAIVSGVSAA
jgi:chromosome segregation ATPase